MKNLSKPIAIPLEENIFLVGSIYSGTIVHYLGEIYSLKLEVTKNEWINKMWKYRDLQGFKDF